MKFLILFILIFSSALHAESFPLHWWDQVKMGSLLGRIPVEAKVLKTTFLTTPLKGRQERIIFPRWVGALKIVCVNTIFDESNIPSSSECTLDVDSRHADVDEKYDQIKVVLKKPATVMGLFNSIPGNGETRSFRAGEKEDGTDFEGHATNIFRYHFTCTKAQCDLRVSNKPPKP